MTRHLRRKASVKSRLRKIVAGAASKAIKSIDIALEPARDVGSTELESNTLPPGKQESARAKQQDEAIHEARRQLKQARAGLRLLRSSLGKSRYHRENRALRDAARPLAVLRDAKVLRASVNEFSVSEFAERDAAEPESARLDAQLLAGLERHLDERLTNLRAELCDNPTDRPAPPPPGESETARQVEGGAGPATVAAARRTLARFRRRARRWRLEGHGWSTVAAGVERVYRAGREALKTARTDLSVAELHEWRKQTKYLGYELEMIEPAWPKRIGKLAQLADRLGVALGDDHDLALLAEVVSQHFSASPEADPLLAKIDQRREALAGHALALGARLYRWEPSAFVDRLRKPWQAWRDG